jgi:cytochrome c6
MKRIFAILVLLVALVGIALPRPALAADLANGAAIFSNKCAACHMGGNNAVNPQKTLKQADLTKYGMDTPEAIIAQVTNGKAAMPKFGGQISEKDIQDVAAYVLDQAAKGWK